jgi:integrase/recombinase XerD
LIGRAWTLNDVRPRLSVRGTRSGCSFSPRAFQRLGRKAGLDKKVTAHILRHTMATTLLFNGCPIGHIKVALGHERLDTTCRYYLGLDLRAAKEAHQEFLKYD